MNKKIKKTELQIELKERQRIINNMKKDRPNVYTHIYSKLSLESEEVIKIDTDYSIFDVDVDPLALWMAIYKPHLVSITSSSKLFIRKN